MDLDYTSSIALLVPISDRLLFGAYCSGGIGLLMMDDVLMKNKPLYIIIWANGWTCMWLYFGHMSIHGKSGRIFEGFVFFFFFFPY